MKSLFTTVLICVIASLGYAQSMYWSVYHFEVKPGFDEEVVNAFDRFFDSETGKSMPYAALGSALFSSSKDDWSHQVIFASPNKADLAKMYSGMLQQSKDYALFGSSLDRSIEGVAAYLGKSILGEDIPENSYSTIYELSVSDPATYVEAFSDLRDAIIDKSDGKLGVVLHQFISGNEHGATHVAVISAPSFQAMLDYTDLIFSSQEMATFAVKVKDIRKRLRTFTTFRMKEYNVPDGM